MGLFDIFSSKNSDAAAAHRIEGLDKAYAASTASLDKGLASANDYYGKALVPFSQLYSQGQQGIGGYMDALGLNGPDGNARAMAAFENNPGLQTQMRYGLQALDRGAASRGMLTSGNTLQAEQKFGNDLANNSWNQYTQSFSPLVTLAGTGATGIGTVNTAAAGTNYQAGKDQAGYDWNHATGVGDANASADLGKNAAAANGWNALMGGVGLATSLLGFGGGGGLTSMLGGPGGGNPSSAAYGSNPFTPYGTRNPAYG